MSDDTVDLTLLRVLATRTRYEALIASVPMDALDGTVRTLLKGYGDAFRISPDLQQITGPQFWTLYLTSTGRGLSEEQRALHKAVLRKGLAAHVDPAYEDGLVAQLATLAAANTVSTAVAAYTEGQDVDLQEILRATVDRTDTLLAAASKDPQERTPIEDILGKLERDWGFSHILPSLNAAMRPLVPGESYCVAARVGRGKSAYITQQAVSMAQEIDKVWPGENRTVLWLINEGTADAMVRRSFQCATGMTLEEMIDTAKRPSETHRNKLVELYAKAMGRPGALRLFNAHGMSTGDVLRLARRYRAGAVVLDMLAHFSHPSSRDARTDQKLEGLWQWIREASAKHDFVAIGTAQLSADADGMQWPDMKMIKDAKTGLQGAVDTMIAIGAVNDPMMRKFRYISVPKTKSYRTGAADPRFECILDTDRMRLSEATQE